MKKYICTTDCHYWSKGEEVEVTENTVLGSIMYECRGKTDAYAYPLNKTTVDRFLTPLGGVPGPKPPPTSLTQNQYPNTAECINQFFEVPVGAIINYRRSVNGGWVEYFYLDQDLSSLASVDTFFNHFKPLEDDQVMSTNLHAICNIKPPCAHVWKKYVGIINTFEYCEKCDLKK